MDLFQQASRLKLRFDSPKGALSVEDLWDIPLTSGTGKANLDDIAKGLNRALREQSEEPSFVTPTAAKPNDNSLAFEVVKVIIGIRVAERDAAAAEADRRQKKQRIMELISQKQDTELAGKSIEELTALAASL